MKLRIGFVSNSSTTSFLFIGGIFTKEELFKIYVEEYNNGKIELNKYLKDRRKDYTTEEEWLEDCFIDEPIIPKFEVWEHARFVREKEGIPAHYLNCFVVGFPLVNFEDDKDLGIEIFKTIDKEIENLKQDELFKDKEITIIGKIEGY